MTPNDNNGIEATDTMTESAKNDTEAISETSEVPATVPESIVPDRTTIPTLLSSPVQTTDESETGAPLDPPAQDSASEEKSLEDRLLPPPSPKRMLGYALLCASVGFLVSLRGFAAATLPHILTLDGYNFQGVQEGLPIPRLLDWDPTQIGLLQQYTTLNPVLLGLGAVLVFGLLWAGTLRALFPSLRLLRPHTSPASDHEESPSLPRTSAVALDGRMLLRLAWLLILVATPLAALGGLALLASARFQKLEIPLQVVWFVAAGIWLRIALRPGGFVARSLFPSDFSTRYRRSPSPLYELGFGIVFGLPAFTLQKYAMRLPSEEVLRSLHALGIFHIGRWNMLAFHYLLSVSLACAAIGLLLLFFMPIPTMPRPRPLPLVFALLCIPLMVWLQRPYTSQALAASWDITQPVMLTAMPYTPTSPMSGVPDGVRAGQELARRAGIPRGNQPASPDRRFLLFTPAGTFDALLHGYNEDNLAADPAAVPKVQAYLKRHDYNTALSWTAFKYLFNVGNERFDNTFALRACMDDLEHTPHAVMTQPLRDMFFTISASPENLALLNEWADPGRFDPADRATLKLLGDIYLRFGEQQKALEWYSRADMPHSFMADIRAHKPLFHAGQIQGALLWNGKPLAGVQVGAFPYLQNGLPKDLEGQVRNAERQLMPGYPFSKIFGPMEPRPYELRWMSAGTTTDSAGHFVLNHLTEGTYHIVCTLPADVVLKPFQDDRLHIVNVPGDLTVRYPKPTKDVGTIELTFHP